ncbi:DUF3426 domain-containing protein [Turicimonas muris]|uniref:DUF3426 domain-containing protein n=3 Tax=Turicimonas muris TaxID=1796652 RepID=A0A227KPX7_9BURK|nr:DUF3426 domain-containing protein [Turicimonas muris]ANU66321.1 hypothetical protein A4V04_07710 [Burkholderiales bacterium YL45]OXE50271.1 hypothetical protein ADH67_04580 [Turicimonas muris]QQQ97464.1 DUF3426 domain-containing protein [Turicimonas muris]
MEPKISGNSKGLRFPYEPSLSQPLKRKEDLIPRIVPAELNSPVPTSAKTETPKISPSPTEPSSAGTSTGCPAGQTPQAPISSTAEPSSVKRKDPREMMAALSKDLEELSTPLSQKPKAVMEPPDENLEAPEEAPTPSGVLRSVMLFICFIVVCLCTWQVALFLQPSIMQQDPLNSISERSCKFFYCPPMRPLRILTSEMNATGRDTWDVSLQVQNQDMRTQRLPQFQVTFVNTNKTIFQKTYPPSEYTVIPDMKSIKGGLSVKIQIPVVYSEGRPSNFMVKVLE